MSARRLHKIEIPRGWMWSGEWTLDKSRGGDEDGWEYAVNFDRQWKPSYSTLEVGERGCAPAHWRVCVLMHLSVGVRC